MSRCCNLHAVRVTACNVRHPITACNARHPIVYHDVPAHTLRNQPPGPSRAEAGNGIEYLWGISKKQSRNWLNNPYGSAEDFVKSARLAMSNCPVPINARFISSRSSNGTELAAPLSPVRPAPLLPLQVRRRAARGRENDRGQLDDVRGRRASEQEVQHAPLRLGPVQWFYLAHPAA